MTTPATSINAQLEEAPAGIIVFSESSRESRWVEAEVGYLTFARIEEGKLLIPVVLGDDAWVPPLLRPLARRRIDEVEAIADAVLGRTGGPPPVVAPERGLVRRVSVSLDREDPADDVRVQVRIGDHVYGNSAPVAIPSELRRAHGEFLHGFRAGLRRSPATAERAALESILANLGRQLRSLCLPGDTGEAVSDLLDGCPVGTFVEFGLDRKPLGQQPVYAVAGPVPQLRIDDLIGRRRELRACLRTLRSESRVYAGVVLTGIGGVGKSAVAGRAMQRLSEDDWLIAAHAGRFDLAGIATAMGLALVADKRDASQQLGALLMREDLNDQGRIGLVAKVLSEQRLVLVLDDFEPNLTSGGGSFLDADVLLLGTRDVFLEDLLDLVRHDGLDDVLLQAAVSNLPVSPAGLSRMLAGEDSGKAGDVQFVADAIDRLQDLSLLHRFPDGTAWVHRWTAEGLARLDEANRHARCAWAGRYRMWRVENESHSLEDAIEAVRNFLAGEQFDAAVRTARTCFAALQRSQQSIGIASLASEVLETLPETHSDFALVADQEAQAHLSLGWTERAFRRYTTLVAWYERLAEAEPERADYQREMVVPLWRLGAEDDAMAEQYLPRAMAILTSLKETGRLQPVDEPLIEQLGAVLRERGLA